MTSDQRDSRLRQFFLFTPADLEANERGTLSDSQQRELQQHGGDVRRALVWILPTCLLLFAPMFVLVLPGAHRSVGSASMAVLPLVVLMVVCCLPLIYYRRTIRRGRVQTVSGVARIKRYLNAPPFTLKRYYLKIGGKKFGLMTAHGHFVEGEPYRVHYINKYGVRTILSAVALNRVV